MRLQAMNICEGKTLYVSSIYIYIFTFKKKQIGGGGEGGWDVVV